MKFILLALLLTTVFAAKSQEDTAKCIAKVLAAAIQVGISTDSVCSDCIGNCIVGNTTDNTFEGYKGSCVDACSCNSANQPYVDAVKSDECANSIQLLIGIAGIIMMILMAIVF